MPASSTDSSAILALPYLQPSQSQKHVTHSEALRRLDVLVQTGVERFGATTPPPTPATGEMYALGAAPVDAWAGQPSALAVWVDGAWMFIAPQPGWRVWGRAEAELRVWDGSAWVQPPADLENVPGLGIGTASDATNRLSVNSDAVLFNNDGAGAQVKINKAADTDTASVLFQSGWSGHAEMGLAGSADFTIKTSPDGAAWVEALHIDNTTGHATGAAVQASRTDATTGRLTTVGAFGLGEAASPTEIADLDGTATATGFYKFTTSTVNIGSLPTALAGGYGLIRVERASATNLTQTAWRNNRTGGVWWRVRSGGTWSAWRNFITTDDSGSRVGLGTAAPAAHLHVKEAGTDIPARIQTTDTGFAGNVLEVETTRAASAAFNLIHASANNAADPKFRIDGLGAAYADAAYSSAGADYAEMFEWADGNPAGEDRRGLSVVLEGSRIRAALPGEEPIGVVSATPTVLGDAAGNGWSGRYLRDDFGAVIEEPCTYVEWTDAPAGEPVHHVHMSDRVPAGLSVPADARRTTGTRPAPNPAHDPARAYIPRADRPEWAPVGMMGKLRMRKGQPVGARWILMREISASVGEWLVR
jgi:hypothetical protein